MSWQHDLDRMMTEDPRDDAEPVCHCELCGDDIYAGETIYEIDDNIICEKCIENSRKIARED